MSAVQVIVRRARPGDEAARAMLLRRELQAKYIETCIYFFCQELTLEGCVLGGAVLFIFCGASPLVCGMVLPAAALVVMLAVFAANVGIAENQLQNLRGETAGWVAEAPVMLGSPPSYCTILQLQEGELPDLASYRQVVGTISVSRHAHTHRRGWLHSLHVHPSWRRRGIARALETAAVESSELALRLYTQTHTLEALTSDLQHNARTFLHSVGWRVSGTYQRRVVGAAVTLPLALLTKHLPSRGETHY